MTGIINYPVRLDGTLLDSITGLSVLATDPYKPAKRVLSIANLARTNKAKLNSAFYNKKVIKVRIGISRTTRALAEVSLDSLMGILQGQEKELLIPQSGGTRKYTVTYSDNNMTHSGGSYIEMELFFETSDHFGYDTAYTLLAQVSGFTSNYKNTTIAVEGSADWQAPLVTVTISALTDGTDKTVTIGNDRTGQQTAVTRTWLAGDVLVVDALNQSVKVNGVEVTFSGGIPEFAPGVGYLTYSDNLGSRTMSMTAKYYRRWV